MRIQHASQGHEQRLFKSSQELRLMRRAGAISAGAHCRAMRECREGRFEYHLEGAILHEFAEQLPKYAMP